VGSELLVREVRVGLADDDDVVRHVLELIRHLAVLMSWQFEQARQARVRQIIRLAVLPEEIDVVPAAAQSVTDRENRSGRAGVFLGGEIRNA
jgi:Flp pilus assembly protein CpaB